MDRYDSVIVCAALVAEALVEPGKPVLIIDKRTPVQGQ